MTLIVYTVAAFGLAYVLGHAVITQRLREELFNRSSLGMWLVLLLECPACCGFWIGFGAGAYGLVLGELSPWLRTFLVAFYTAGANFLLGRATKLIGHPRGEP